jgi:hypothetical protein
MNHNPFQVPITKPSNPPTPGNTLPCPVCGKDQFIPSQWRVCLSCDESLGVPLHDASPQTMRQWTGVGVWPSAVAGRA